MQITQAMAKPELIWGMALGCFVADRVINAAVSIPLFISAIPLLLALMIRTLTADLRKAVVATSVLFIGLFFIHLTRFGWSKSNLSDLLTLLLFITALPFVSLHKSSFTKRSLTAVTSIALLLFLPVLLGFENRSVAFTAGHIPAGRTYHQGLFRVPHIAAYFVGFTGLLQLTLRNRQAHILGILLLLSSFYTGTRSFLLSGLAGLVFLGVSVPKWRKITLGLTGFAAAMVATATSWGPIVEHPITVPYLDVLYALHTDASSLSRLLIWDVWWHNITDFSFLDWLFGRSMQGAVDANNAVLNYPVWFHNDFLQITYAYGLVGFSAFIMVWLWLLRWVRSNRVGTYLAYTALFCALLNGFYTYFPMLFVLPFLMFNPQEIGESGN